MGRAGVLRGTQTPDSEQKRVDLLGLFSFMGKRGDGGGSRQPRRGGGVWGRQRGVASPGFGGGLGFTLVRDRAVVPWRRSRQTQELPQAGGVWATF